MLVARSLHAHTRLVAQIKAREVERVYEAVVTVLAALARYRGGAGRT